MLRVVKLRARLEASSISNIWWFYLLKHNLRYKILLNIPLQSYQTVLPLGMSYEAITLGGINEASEGTSIGNAYHGSDAPRCLGAGDGHRAHRAQHPARKLLL